MANQTALNYGIIFIISGGLEFRYNTLEEGIGYGFFIFDVTHHMNIEC